MTKRVSALLFGLILSFSFVDRALSDDRCIVADPTGTPLNVRTSPYGTIIGTLNNGITVRIREISSLRGKTWVRAHDLRMGVPRLSQLRDSREREANSWICIRVP
jgi:hypothetical protein